MKRIDFLRDVSELFSFKTISDEQGHDFVVWKSSALNQILGVTDKTEFEAVENHVHLLDNIKKHEISSLIEIGKSLGEALLASLVMVYPEKHFFVFASITLGDSFIIRFHQKWESEAPYFDIENLQCNDKEYVITLFA